MSKSVAEKMGLKPGTRAFLHHAPPDAVKAIQLPSLELSTTLTGDFEYIFFFTKSQEEFHQTFPALKEHLKAGGMLWACWPKGRQQGTDLTLTTVIKLGYAYGLVESTSLSINAVWSALKFTHPKPGKSYHNKYGKLPDGEKE
jgi:hypothetical protein